MGDTQTIVPATDTPSQATSAPEAQNPQKTPAEGSGASQKAQETSEQKARRLHDVAFAKVNGNSVNSDDGKSAPADEPEPEGNGQGTDGKQAAHGAQQNGQKTPKQENKPAEASEGPSLDECRRALLRAKFSTERIAKMSEADIREFGSVFKASQAEQDALGAKLGRQRSPGQEQQPAQAAANSEPKGGQQSAQATKQPPQNAPSQQPSQNQPATTPIVDVNAFKEKIERVRAEAGDDVANVMTEMLDTMNSLGATRIQHAEQAVAAMQQQFSQQQQLVAQAMQAQVETQFKNHLSREFPQVNDPNQLRELMTDLTAVASARGPMSDTELMELAQLVANLRWPNEQRNMQRRLVENATRQTKGTPSNAGGESTAENKKLTPKQLSDKANEMAAQGKSAEEIRAALRRYKS